MAVSVVSVSGVGYVAAKVETEEAAVRPTSQPPLFGLSLKARSE